MGTVGDGPEDPTPQQLYEAGLAAFKKGDQDASRRLNQRLVEAGRATDAAPVIAMGLIGLARVAFRDGDLERVGALCEECLPIWEGLDDRGAVTSPIHMLAELARARGEFSKARTLYERSLAISREFGDSGMEAMELMNIALLESLGGDRDRVVSLAAESIAIDPDEVNVAYGLLALASVEAESDAAHAARVLSGAQAIMQRAGTLFDPTDQPLVDSTSRRIGEQLEPSTLEEASRSGATMTLEDALGLLLDDG